jgi:hypothetical protein
MWPKAINICSICNGSNILNTLIHGPTHGLIHSLTCHLIHGLIHSLTHHLIHGIMCGLIHGPMHGIIHGPTCSLSHGPTTGDICTDNNNPHYTVVLSTSITANIALLMWCLPVMWTHLMQPDAAFPKYTLFLMQPFTYTVNLFSYILLIFPSPTFIPTSMQQRYSNILFPYFCSNLWFLLPCNENKVLLSF